MAPLHFTQAPALEQARKSGGIVYKLNDEEGRHRFGAIESYSALFEMLLAVAVEDRFGFEVLTQGMPCKPYLDFDMKCDDWEQTLGDVTGRLRKAAVRALQEWFEESITPDDVYITNGSREGKLSLHLTVTTQGETLHFENAHCRAQGAYAFAWAVVQALDDDGDAEMRKCVDMNVYKKNQVMRLVHCSKGPTNRVPLVPVDARDAPPACYVVGWIDDGKPRRRIEVPERLRAQVQPVLSTSTSTVSLSQAVDRPEWVQEVVEAVPGMHWRPYETWIKIAMACKSLGVSFELFDSLSRQHGDEKYGNTAETWGKLCARENDGPGIGTLLKMIKDRDEEAFRALMMKRSRPAQADEIDECVNRALAALYGGGCWRTRMLMSMQKPDAIYLLGSAESELCGAGRSESGAPGCKGPRMRVQISTRRAHVYCNNPECCAKRRRFAGSLPRHIVDCIYSQR